MIKRLLTVLVLFMICSATAADKVIFIPGWLSHRFFSLVNPKLNYKNHLQKIWQKEDIEIRYWDSCHGWNRSRNNADRFAKNLAESLIKMPREERERVILIGHSLGGRITVKTLSILAENGLKIRQGIALGAAIPANTPELKKALAASERPFINVFSYDDNVLKYAYGNAERIFALGFCGSFQEYEHLKQYTFVNPEAQKADLVTEAKELMIHASALYIQKLQEIKEGKLAEFSHKVDHRKVIINPPIDIIPEQIILPPVGRMKIEKSHEDWRLVSIPVNTNALLKKNPGKEKYFFLILDPYGRWRYWSFVKDNAFVHFDSVKSQLEQLRIR